MRLRIVNHLIPVLAVIMLSSMLFSAWAAQKAGLMTKEELQKILTNADTYVLDVRTGRDWKSSEFKIQGAHRTNPSDFDAWSSKFPKSGTLVLYCA